MITQEIKKLKEIHCIGMIMDGNRRWAKERGLPSTEGHRRAYNKLKEVAEWVTKEGIKNLILYAFSTENWQRSKEEVSYLMDLFRFMLDKEISLLKKNNIRVSFIGDLSLVPEDIKALIEKAEKETLELKKLHLVIAFSYGGRREIVNTVKEIVKTKSKEEIENLSEEEFSTLIWTGKINVPDPDLVIRTSGDMRTSNFLTWQSVYSEWFFIKTLWPDFSYEEFKKILEEFSLRERRLGK